jgi:hypothetical protein
MADARTAGVGSNYIHLMSDVEIVCSSFDATKHMNLVL